MKVEITEENLSFINTVLQNIEVNSTKTTLKCLMETLNNINTPIKETEAEENNG